MSDASDIKYYEIQYKTDQQETTAKTSNAYNSHTITGLKSNMLYQMRVRPVTNEGQKGEWSSYITVHTGKLKINERSTENPASST